jgi:uncharacterized membrane protein YcaP (DUF421 family)
MDNTVINTIIKCIIVYILALILTRLMGRKEISQMTFFDFLVGVSMGSIVANAIIGNERMSKAAVTAVIVLALLEIITSYLHIKSFGIRKLVNSEPVVVVKNGIIAEANVRRMRLTIDELMMKLREKNIFNIADVEYAIMETDGKMSVLPKSQKQPLTPKHLSIKTKKSGLTRDVIIDGNIMEENLKSVGLDDKWIKGQLRVHGIKDVSDVFYAGLDSNKKLHISKRNANVDEKHGEYGIE